MSTPQVTCWTLIEGAAANRDKDRDEFARRYLPAVEAYLSARWRGGARIADREDAVQEVFVECFRQGGALERMERSGDGSFRGFLYGVARNVARRFEKVGPRGREVAGASLGDVVEDEPTLSRAFDRAWAIAQMREAWTLLEARASEAGERALERVELLRLRVEDDLPIRDIASKRGVDAAQLHEDYRVVRQEFRRALLDAVSFHLPDSEAAAEKECAALLGLLGQA